MTTQDAMKSAISWTMQLAESDFSGWDEFTAWLEADPSHLDAYKAVQAAGDDAEAVIRPQSNVPVVGPRRAPRGMWLGVGGLVAASIAAVVGWTSFDHGPARYLVETAPGGSQKIQIDGATIALNGATRVVLDRHDPRMATVERGEVLFDVRHDPAHPFTVHTGGVVLQDIGTRFDVVHEGGMTRVAVAQGAVMLNPGGQSVRIDAGHMLSLPDGGTAIELRQVSPDAVDGWSKGRLAYVRTPLAVVAADLARKTGLPIAAEQDVQASEFTGVIAVDSDRQRFLADLGPLLGVRVHQQDGRVSLTRTAPSYRP